MTDLFHGQGALTRDELKEFIEMYEKYGHHNYQDSIHLGGGPSSEIDRIVNQLSGNMGNLSDRLALTIIDLAKKKTQHNEGCTIYAGLVHRIPEAGICTCGYGLQVRMETGRDEEFYSQELREKMNGEKSR